ncbi:glycosyltransferase [Rhizobium sp. BR 314]|uniref:glycosyltransferase n=1 Tax=Rhizobium sp. BR 314 TaxID=3040013 RepID=UPI0039BFEBB0
MVFIVASPRDSMCGVADYTTRLAAAFAGTSVTAVVEYPANFSFSTLMDIRRRHGRDAAFHLQYPSLGMGKSFGPALIPLLFSHSFVTLHEFRLFSLARKLIFLVYALLSKAVVFSSSEERDLFARWFPFSKSRLVVMPIGNNIPRHTVQLERRAARRIVYFGQISRDKGIEVFIETVRRLKTAGRDIEAVMIGALVDGHSEIVEMVRAAERDLRVRLALSLPSDDVSRELAAADMALLPFPGGVTDKRGSALACLDHGVTLLTTHSETTPDWLKQVSYPIEDAESATLIVARLIDGALPPDPAPEIRATELKVREWPEIARRLIALYKRSIAERP